MTHPMGGGGRRPQHKYLRVIESVFTFGKGVVVARRVDVNGIARSIVIAIVFH